MPEGSSFKEIKVITTFESSLSGIVALLNDKESFPKWIYRCEEARQLEKVSDFEYYHYQKTSAVWPVSDRDVIIHFVIRQNPQNKKITITATGQPEYMKSNKGIVRVRDYYAIWEFEPLPGGKVNGTYTLRLNPGGDVPAWIINLGVAEGPVNTIKNMKKMLNEAKYKNAKLAYIKELE